MDAVTSDEVATLVLRISAISFHSSGVFVFLFFCSFLLNVRGVQPQRSGSGPSSAGLEAWRLERLGPQGKFVLFGHSMGAIISANYTKTYPRNVHHLLLAGPAGVKEPDAAKLAKLLKKTFVLRTVAYLWNAGLTPMMVVRALPGRLAPWLVKRYVRSRWQGGGALDDETIDVISQYAVGVLMLRGCSEQAMRLCLQPLAQTRSPIGPIVEKELPVHIPVDFIYGDRDWMNPTHGIEVVERMKAAGRKNVEVYVLPYGVREIM